MKEKLSAFLPKSNQFAVELRLQIILKLQKDEGHSMTEENYNEIIGYCFEVLEILDKLTVGECYIKGVLLYEIAKAQIKIAEFQNLPIDHVREIFQIFS